MLCSFEKFSHWKKVLPVNAVSPLHHSYRTTELVNFTNFCARRTRARTLKGNIVCAKIPTKSCGHRSRAFRAVLKRQEVKGRAELGVCRLYSLVNPAKMTSEKADVIYPSPKKNKFEQLRADHELFLQAFESKSVVFFRPEIYTVLRFIQFNRKILNL